MSRSGFPVGGPAPRSAGRPGFPRTATARLPAELTELLHSHEPFLACAVDAEWNLLASNLMWDEMVAPAGHPLSLPRPNLLRLVLHPMGLAARLENLAEVHRHLLDRLRRRRALNDTAFLGRLEREISAYRETEPGAVDEISVPVRLWVGPTLVDLISFSAFVGVPWEAASAVVTVEYLMPADPASRDFLFSGPVADPPDRPHDPHAPGPDRP